MRRHCYLALLAAGLAVCGVLASGGQQPPSAPPAEQAALLTAINDIDKLRVLNPLKLKPDQIDRMVPVIERSQKDYTRRVADAMTGPLRAMADDISSTRSKVLAGGAIPAAFDERLKKLQDQFLEQRKREDEATLRALSEEMRKVLTPEQVATAASLARKSTESDGKATLRGTDEQFFNLYLIGTVIHYARIVPLLKDMRQALASTATSEAAAPPAQP